MDAALLRQYLSPLLHLALTLPDKHFIPSIKYPLGTLLPLFKYFLNFYFK